MKVKLVRAIQVQNNLKRKSKQKKNRLILKDQSYIYVYI